MNQNLNNVITDAEYLDSVTGNQGSGLQGWLDSFTADITLKILRFQEVNHIKGSLYEVGLYYGKYFSVLARSSTSTNESLCGFDIFHSMSNQQDFTIGFENATGFKIDGNLISVHKINSTEIDFNDLLKYLKSPARFISIDGSHEGDDVLWDLQTAEKVLAPGGIIAADDFLNSGCIGVNEAVNRFLISNTGMAPIACFPGKLFICRAPWANRYREFLLRSIINDTTSPRAEKFRKTRESHKFATETKFHGFTTLLMPW